MPAARLTLLAIIFTVAFISSAFADSPADSTKKATDEKHLYPRCAGEESPVQIVAPSQQVVLASLPFTATQISISCLAYDVQLDDSSAAASSGCRVAHQTELPYRLVLRAVSRGSSSSTAAEWDIRILGAGSISQATYTVPSTSTGSSVAKYEIVLVNNGNCKLRGRVLVTATANNNYNSMPSPPTLVNVNPAVVYSSRRQYTYFVLNHASATAASADSGARVRLTAANETCTSATNPNAPLLFYVDEPTVRAKVLATSYTPDSRDLDSVWKYYFDRSGTYQLCFYASSSVESGVSLARFAVYQGNPSYYTFESGLGPRGQVYVGRAVTVHFHGSNLDTRPDGDAAKFVRESDTCESGRPAGGVRVETDLGPADDYGPNTRYTSWTWTLVQTGSFRICYRRKDHAWEEVLSRDEVASQADLYQGTGDTPAAPAPTDRITHDACPLAPKNAPAVMSNALLHIVLGSATVPSAFPSHVADVLCLPRAAVVVVRQSTATSGAHVWLDIDCNVGEDNLPVCDPTERRQYFLFLAASESPLVRVNLQITSISPTKSDEIFGVADPDHGGVLGSILPAKHRGLYIVGICLTLLAVAGMAVFAVIKYRENQPYFIQFGLDDDDDEGVIKVGGGSAADAAGTNGRYVPDATIEMELEDDNIHV